MLLAVYDSSPNVSFVDLVTFIFEVKREQLNAVLVVKVIPQRLLCLQDDCSEIVL